MLIFFGCDSNRVYEKNHDLEERAWISTEHPVFEFTVQDTSTAYNLYCNVRNSVTYPYSRIFINYSLQDSTGTSVTKSLISSFLFEEKTGTPLGIRFRC
jgi:gliding motility-associated lipoprotein GldH